MEKVSPIDFAKYLISSGMSQLTNNINVVSEQKANEWSENENCATETNNDMPKLRFRNYICDGLSKQDDDNLAKTSLCYIELQFAQALGEDEESQIFADHEAQVKL